MTAQRSGAPWQDRLAKVVPISPLADLAPFMRTSMNADLKLDDAEVQSESPIYLPKPAVPVTIWVGADERPVFLEQAEAMAAAWQCEKVVAPGMHHFNIIEGLTDPASALTAAVLE